MQRRQGKGREGMRHLPDLGHILGPILGHIRPDCTAWQGEPHLGSGVQILRQSAMCKCLKCAVWCACVSVLLDLHRWHRLCKPCPPAPYEKFPQSFKHVHRPYQLPTCRPACAVTSLFGCESLRSTPLETCLSVLQVHYLDFRRVSELHYLDYRRVSELHYLGTSGPCLYC